jgi:hypothetical protein
MKCERAPQAQVLEKVCVKADFHPSVVHRAR